MKDENKAVKEATEGSGGEVEQNHFRRKRRRNRRSLVSRDWNSLLSLKQSERGNERVRDAHVGDVESSKC